MSLSNLKRWINKNISIEKRLSSVLCCYLVFLLYMTKKKSLIEAAQFSRLHKSQFSRFLKKHPDKAVVNLKNLSKKQAKQLARILKKLANNGLPWKIAIIIDSTIQHRSYRHTQNAQRFNHGQGFVIGHQWTNIVLLINDIIIPLPPIPFHTKKYCKEMDIKYRTEHELVIQYLEELDLREFVGQHNPAEVVVLADSGYDDKNIENTIIKKRWKFIIALSKTRGVKSKGGYSITKKSRGFSEVAEFFKTNRRLKWTTIRLYITNGLKRKRKDFRIKQTKGYLRNVGEVQLICSEFKKRPDGRRKYLVCNDLKATARHILLGYRLRWEIEIFHKDIKQNFGFEDVATSSFNSDISHVHWVYCAYILLNMVPLGIPENKLSVREKQFKLKEIIDAGKIVKWRQTLTQFNGSNNLLNELSQVIHSLYSR
jgi:hypothetical protein